MAVGEFIYPLQPMRPVIQTTQLRWYRMFSYQALRLQQLFVTEDGAQEWRDIPVITEREDI
jgi:hypothetical protein